MLKLVKTANGVLNDIKDEKNKNELIKMVPQTLKTIDELLSYISAAGKMPQNKVLYGHTHICIYVYQQYKVCSANFLCFIYSSLQIEELTFDSFDLECPNKTSYECPEKSSNFF
jgi:hypothetical protein